MDGKPLTTAEAWSVHDRLFEDDRVLFVTEPAGIESSFRESTLGRRRLPNYGDAWLLAFARVRGDTDHLRSGARGARRPLPAA